MRWFEAGVSLSLSYSRMPANVELSKVPLPLKNGLASMKNSVAFVYSAGFVFNTTLVVCTGPMRMMSEFNVSNIGFSNSHGVVCYAEKQFSVHCSVDQTEKI